MFPTAHDITPALLKPSIAVLKKLCDAGNTVLVVSKPHCKCVAELCYSLIKHNANGTDRIFFRFTIGAMDDDVLSYWEPNAPPFRERIASLKLAGDGCGFRTSVSIEPMLDAPNVVALFHALKPWVTDSIWIGKMNHVRRRVKIETAEDERRVRLLEDGQQLSEIWFLYDTLRNEPLVRWKESIKSVVGLPLATEAGEDR
jgi:hypothetical protein